MGRHGSTYTVIAMILGANHRITAAAHISFVMLASDKQVAHLTGGLALQANDRFP